MSVGTMTNRDALMQHIRTGNSYGAIRIKQFMQPGNDGHEPHTPGIPAIVLLKPSTINMSFILLSL